MEFPNKNNHPINEYLFGCAGCRFNKYFIALLYFTNKSISKAIVRTSLFEMINNTQITRFVYYYFIFFRRNKIRFENKLIALCSCLNFMLILYVYTDISQNNTNCVKSVRTLQIWNRTLQYQFQFDLVNISLSNDASSVKK